MTESSFEMQRLLAAAFGHLGWEYDLETARRIVEEVERRGSVDPERLAGTVGAEFLARNGTSREHVAEVIESALAHVVPRPDTDAVTSLVVNNNTFVVGAGAAITNSPVNVGGAQINVDLDRSPDNLLAAVEALVRAGIRGHWNADAARELEAALSGQDDVRFEDIERLTVEVVNAEQPTVRGAASFLRDVATAGLGGALGPGIIAGVSQLIQTLAG